MIKRAPKFHLPDEKTSPVIMIGAGTGIAPFRSFWLERKIDKMREKSQNGVIGNKWGEMVLYFGCRNSHNEDLYCDEIKQLVKSGVINEYHRAYSEPKKTRV